ncbi:bifunctional 3-(3-hydroxy-phenyl)propionate/3-hydroxycinnamic acid hydroxylase [Gordonia sp. TBRC 11910]|uniref:Bifunctional 3-(3-hydroxy-phenyl)propionate/3-hydroxycinnamic acid hydroxylase n=1 Tax=Gordonia asplenii TaxID=2725283 RepID=A0A848L3E3_9ACTN|nr:bifunctional 3-(3-hydroxy-phenyl)propionate/3-hydroxycinnamic acid hydroxylase [Gordonia asplenii]NMO03575.1 bifunctional 3-(3-hydroxy-phenyl)propionate/3-hydroxycinnamic acid hydroxylase [Gordonia asplenii]
MANTAQTQADVVIVGYGPTGVTAALTLARRGARVVVLERDRDLYQRARAVTVNDWTMRIFQDLGLDDRVTRVVEAQRALRWVTYSGEELMRVEHPESTLGVRPRFFNIYQPTMEAEIRSYAAEFPDIDVRFGVEFDGLTQDDAGVTVAARDVETGAASTIWAHYVIGADGGSSPTRHAIGTALLGDTLDVEWIVIDCRVKRWWPDRDFLTFWSDRRRPVVDIALSAGNHRWELPLNPGETPADFDTPEKVWPLLNALGVTDDDVDIHQWAFYRHHTRMAQTWRAGRVFLAGDAAHLMPPWAGAGMQTGIRDAHNLGWKLARVLDGSVDDAWLDSYEAERRPNAEFYTQLAIGLGRVIKQEATPEEIEAMNRVPEGLVTPFEPPLIAPPSITAGWLRGPVGDASIVGRMIPQPVVGDARGAMARLDDLLGHGFVLLGADVDPASLLSVDEKAQWDRLGARYVAVRPQSAYTQGPDELVDLDRALLPWFARYGVKAVAVRPDRFIAAADVSGLEVPA